MLEITSIKKLKLFNVIGVVSTLHKVLESQGIIHVYLVLIQTSKIVPLKVRELLRTYPRGDCVQRPEGKRVI